MKYAYPMQCRIPYRVLRFIGTKLTTWQILAVYRHYNGNIPRGLYWLIYDCIDHASEHAEEDGACPIRAKFDALHGTLTLDATNPGCAAVRMVSNPYGEEREFSFYQWEIIETK